MQRFGRHVLDESNLLLSMGCVSNAGGCRDSQDRVNLRPEVRLPRLRPPRHAKVQNPQSQLRTLRRPRASNINTTNTSFLTRDFSASFTGCTSQLLRI